MLTEEMQREEDSNVVVEYSNIKLETDLKSELKKKQFDFKATPKSG